MIIILIACMVMPCKLVCTSLFLYLAVGMIYMMSADDES